MAVIEESTTDRELYRSASADHPNSGPAGRRGRRTVLATDAVTLVAGLWLLSAPWALNFTGSGRLDGFWNDMVAGAVIGLAALVQLAEPAGAVPVRVGSLLLGIWIAAAPYALGYAAVAAPRATANEVVVGVSVAVLAVLGLRAVRLDGRPG